MGATRLPGKVLEDLAGQPMLYRVINRARRSKTLDDVVVATTINPADEAISKLCEAQDRPFFRGSEDDVLDRYYRTASSYGADIIVRITSDCPLIEPEIIDKAVDLFKSSKPKADYVTNTLVRTYPRGLDVEVFGYQTLKEAWQSDDNPAWREHVTPYIYRNPQKFNLYNFTSEQDYSYMRWTVDMPEDLSLVRNIYDHFKNDTFNWKDVISVLEKHPEWLELNRQIQQKPVL